MEEEGPRRPWGDRQQTIPETWRRLEGDPVEKKAKKTSRKSSSRWLKTSAGAEARFKSSEQTDSTGNLL